MYTRLENRGFLKFEATLLLYCELCQNESNKVNNELMKINQWLIANRLSLNIDKSNYVIFQPSQKKSEIISLSISSKCLTREKSVKYLGVIFDEHLNWKCHVNQISKKISRNIGILAKMRYYVPQNILKQLYYCLIYPYLTYGILVWGNAYENSIKNVVILQKKVIRIISFSEYNSHTIVNYLKNLNS